MELLGNRNWYLPSWLGWLPRIGIEGGEGEARELRERGAAAGAPAVSGSGD